MCVLFEYENISVGTAAFINQEGSEPSTVLAERGIGTWCRSVMLVRGARAYCRYVVPGRGAGM